jgi:hypothetical protein
VTGLGGVWRGGNGMLLFLLLQHPTQR